FDAEGISHKTFKSKFPITDIAFMADGASLFVAHENNIVSQYTGAGEFIRDIETEHASVSSIDISSNGRYMISSGTDEVVALWNLNKVKNEPIVAHKEAVTHVKFSADGERFVTVSEDSTAKVWDNDGDHLFTLSGHKGPVLWADFSTDGKKIVTTGLDNTALVWNADGELIRTIDRHNEAVTSASFSYDNRYIITTAHDYKSCLWSAKGELIYTFEGSKDLHEQHDLGLFSPDGQHLLVISRDITNAGIVSIFNISPDRMIRNINNQDLLGKVWQMDEPTKQRYNVLE
ncbi:MAG: hypothetical protein F6K17_20770, partial [Okeania sp. SIO3C4]|nr:hypothetical protein [Okeania sp. SIO3C4]